MEFVYVVERRRLFDLAFPHGLVSAAERREEVGEYLRRIRAHGFFVERRKAEEDSSLKQIIPYVVVCRAGEVLLLTRGDRQGEARLHGKRSIGIGGHINPVDHSEGDVLLRGLDRELDEELHLATRPELSLAGFLNDDSTPVGSVHFGMVVVARVRTGTVRIRETEMMDGTLVRVEQLLHLHEEEPARFETWSALLLQRWSDVAGADLPLQQTLERPA
jgi:predicted NUDIX family phosphoesterase